MMVVEDDVECVGTENGRVVRKIEDLPPRPPGGADPPAAEKKERRRSMASLLLLLLLLDLRTAASAGVAGTPATWRQAPLAPAWHPRLRRVVAASPCVPLLSAACEKKGPQHEQYARRSTVQSSINKDVSMAPGPKTSADYEEEQQRKMVGKKAERSVPLLGSHSLRRLDEKTAAGTPEGRDSPTNARCQKQRGGLGDRAKKKWEKNKKETGGNEWCSRQEVIPTNSLGSISNFFGQASSSPSE
ncbi:unnamed protein product [Caenorhabditis auriculariae]|uniref:Uncharacterized protein n=1 Tax=Caenorhabditis auriculariae TaxID=2777116 RepID=A0A8S1HN46_9PELO|nr:unnamed protein product [Caenorhabditis auriculariae]